MTLIKSAAKGILKKKKREKQIVVLGEDIVRVEVPGNMFRRKQNVFGKGKALRKDVSPTSNCCLKLNGHRLASTGFKAFFFLFFFLG
jgi:hypothetical protein